MNFNGMTFDDMKRINEYNIIIRNRLLNRAQKLPSDIQKAQFIIDYFTNNLPRNIIADIDNVKEKDVVDFKYDYSYVKGSETPYPREQKLVKYPLGYGTSISCVDRDIEVDGKPKIYPTIFSLKLGTCIMFANEIKRLMSNLGLTCEIIETPNAVDCYDYFNGKDTNGNMINVNTIKKMKHFYNIITIDGKQLKVDISGYLTSLDYNRNHPDGIKNPIDPSRFSLTEDIASNPFEEAIKGLTE